MTQNGHGTHGPKNGTEPSVSSGLLNENLYHALAASGFKNLQVHNQGNPGSWQLGLKGRIQVTYWGECYSVACPFCHDKRSHLWFSHLWGRVINGHKVEPAYCYRTGNCLSIDRNRRQLYKWIVTQGYTSTKTNQEVPVKTEEGLREVSLPNGCIPLEYLPRSHAACRYVLKRNYDPVWLSQHFGVHAYIGYQDKRLIDRIIVPIYFQQKMVGWLGRSYTDQEPKYYNSPGLKKSLLLYNYDNVTENDSVILVEGIFDVFRLTQQFNSHCAVALLGKSISLTQEKLVKSTWPDSIFIMLDSDAAKDALEIKQRIPQATIINLTKGDPDEFSCPNLRSIQLAWSDVR